jgi:hypothetical protein
MLEIIVHFIDIVNFELGGAVSHSEALCCSIFIASFGR